MGTKGSTPIGFRSYKRFGITSNWHMVKRFRIVRGISIALLAGASSPVTAAMDGYSVTGKLDCVFYNSNGSVFTNQTLNFEVLVAGEKWQVKSFEESGAFWVRGCDGDSIYHLFEDGSMERPVNLGLVEDGPMPSSGYASALPWLAFASAPFLRSHQQLPFAPWANPYFEPAVCAYASIVSLSPQPPYLPESADFVVDADRIESYRAGRYFVREGKTRGDIQRQAMRVRTEPIGFKGGYYRVLSYTNYHGLRLPLQFQLVKLRPRVTAGHGSNSPVAAVFSGSGIGYGLVNLVSGLPDIQVKPVSVTDLRFRSAPLHIDGISYMTTNEWVTDTNAARLVAAFKAEIASTSRFIPGDKRRLAVMAVLVVLAVLPLAYGAMRILRHHRGGPEL